MARYKYDDIKVVVVYETPPEEISIKTTQILIRLAPGNPKLEEMLMNYGGGDGTRKVKG